MVGRTYDSRNASNPHCAHPCPESINNKVPGAADFVSLIRLRLEHIHLFFRAGRNTSDVRDSEHFFITCHGPFVTLYKKAFRPLCLPMLGNKSQPWNAGVAKRNGDVKATG